MHFCSELRVREYARKRLHRFVGVIVLRRTHPCSPTWSALALCNTKHWGIAFNTAHGRIKGARDLWGAISNEADFIFVDGDKVSFYVSGVDFPATAKPPTPI